MKKIIVFLGPSLPIAEAQKVLDAVYLPPAKQADLISAVTTYKPDVIGLIDGLFLTYPSVWHKEILYALEQGVRVYGASSLGALRAAETAAFGMIGVGEVYQMYASGELFDDDEVALIHGLEDTGYRPLSEPMVNVRSTFRLAKDEKIISETLFVELIAIAKSIYFPERTFPAIFSQAITAGILPTQVEKLARFVKENYVDTKRKDAILLLETLRDLPKALPEVNPNFSLIRNQFFSSLYYRDRTVQRDNTSLPLGDIAGYAALHLPDFNDVNLHASNRALVQILAEVIGVTVSQREVDQESHRFRSRHTLNEENAFQDWLDQNDLSLEEFKQLMYEMACCRRLQTWLFTKKATETNTKLLLDELRLENRYSECADAAAKREQLVQDSCFNFDEENYDDLTMARLALEHERSTGCSVSFREEWVDEAGFLSSDLLKLELMRSHFARKAMQNRKLPNQSSETI